MGLDVYCLPLGTVEREVYCYSLEDGTQTGKITPAVNFASLPPNFPTSTKGEARDASPQKMKSFARSLKKTFSFQTDTDKDKEKEKDREKEKEKEKEKERKDDEKEERGRGMERGDEEEGLRRKRFKSRGRTPRDQDKKDKTPREFPDSSEERHGTFSLSLRKS